MFLNACRGRVGGFQPIPWRVPNPRDWDYLPPGQAVGLRMHISLQSVSLSACRLSAVCWSALFLLKIVKEG